VWQLTKIVDETVQRERSICTNLKRVFGTEEEDERRIRNEISMIKQEVQLWDRTEHDTSQKGYKGNMQSQL